MIPRLWRAMLNRKIELPDLSLATLKDAEEVLDLHLSVTEKALNQLVDSSKLIYTRAGSVLTQTCVLAVAALGAIPFIDNVLKSQNISPTFAYIPYGLLASCIFLSFAAIAAALGMHSYVFGTLSPDVTLFEEEALFTEGTLETKFFLLKVRLRSLEKGLKVANELANRLNCSILLMVLSPFAGACFLFFPILFSSSWSYALHFLRELCS